MAGIKKEMGKEMKRFALIDEGVKRWGGAWLTGCQPVALDRLTARVVVNLQPQAPPHLTGWPCG